MFFKKGAILELVDVDSLNKDIDLNNVDLEELSYAMVRITVVKKTYNNKIRLRGKIVYSTNREKYAVGGLYETESRLKSERLDLDPTEYMWYDRNDSSTVAIELRHLIYKLKAAKGPIAHPGPSFNRDNRKEKFFTVMELTNSIVKHRRKYIASKSNHLMAFNL